jgi:serine/threonine protein kinase
MASHPEKESSPALSLDEEIELDEIVPTTLAPGLSGSVDVAATAPSMTGSSPTGPSTSASSSATTLAPPGRGERSVVTRAPALNPLADLPILAYYSRFALLGRIAWGGMAEIFLARETTSAASRHLVVKRILPHVADDEGFVTMFLDEARLAMRLQHPNICPVYEFGEAAGTWFIAMEWVDGVPLGKLIRKARATGGVPIPLVVRVIAQTSEALHYAHRARDENGAPLGIVHRDVSPQNIMVAYNGNVKLLDFGVAKAASHETRTQAGVVKGKLAYMAPEQCRGDAIDARADVFGLGVCLYEALVGRPLYQRQTDFETLKAVIEEPVPSARTLRPEVPADLDAIVQRALAKTPEARWQSAGELQEALEQWLTDHRERVNAARTAEYLEGLYAEEIARGPALHTGSVAPASGRLDSLLPGGGSVPSLPAARMTSPTPMSGSAQILSSSGIVSSPASIPASLAPPAVAPLASLATPLAGSDVITARPPGLPPKGTSPWLVRGGIAFALLFVGGLCAGWWWLRGDSVPVAAIPAPVAAPAPPAPPAPAPPAPIAAPAPAAPIAAPEPVMAPPSDPELGLDALPSDAPVPAPAPRAPALVEVPDDTPRPVVAAADTPRDGARARAQGTLALNTRPWSKAYVGGRLLGTTPFGGVSVPAGPVTLRLVDRDGNTHRRTVRVEAGREASAFFDLSAGGE